MFHKFTAKNSTKEILTVLSFGTDFVDKIYVILWFVRMLSDTVLKCVWLQWYFRVNSYVGV